ncbi:MAG: DTW domain-containing protein [Myxococcota bacterium]
MDTPTRPTCLRCRRPESVCACDRLRPLESRTRVVFLQHPREGRVPVSTCRLAHLSLPNSEMHVGLGPEGSPRLEALAREPGTMVLFPGPGSIDVRALPSPPRTLIVVDGTWINARKTVERSPLLAALPRVGFAREAPSNYRIRKEPAAHCLSTIEAVAHVLEELEAAPGRFAPILGSFDRMVDLQLAYAGASRVRRHAKRPSPVERLRALGERLVLVVADGGGDADGLLWWEARRPATGARLSLELAPRKPVPPRLARHLSPAGGVTLDVARARWAEFARPDDVACTWGRHDLDLLAGIGMEAGERVDLKHLVSNLLHVPLGGLEHLAEGLGAVLPDGRGRAARRIVALEVVVAALSAGALRR